MTPFQTVGPFFPAGFADPALADLGGPGELTGRVTEDGGGPAVNMVVELWHPVQGWGRAATDADGRYRFRLAPGEGIMLMLFGSGIMTRHVARVPGGATEFDIRLSGEGETPFVKV